MNHYDVCGWSVFVIMSLSYLSKILKSTYYDEDMGTVTTFVSKSANNMI
jgi:hypothetical protein